MYDYKAAVDYLDSGYRMYRLGWEAGTYVAKVDGIFAFGKDEGTDNSAITELKEYEMTDEDQAAIDWEIASSYRRVKVV